MAGREKNHDKPEDSHLSPVAVDEPKIRRIMKDKRTELTAILLE